MTFDYIILGGGLAGISLAYRMISDDFFKDKSIAIIEPNPKNQNDRTWSFWEKGQGIFESVVAKKWNQLKFFYTKGAFDLDIGDYQYKMIKGIDFYATIIPQIKNAPNVTWIAEEVKNIENQVIQTESNKYQSKHIFQSFFHSTQVNKEDYLYVDQHFKGWDIETSEDIFDDNQATFMDFRIDQEGHTQFFYVLPTSKRKALVEIAIFSNEIWSQEKYDTTIRNYIENYLNIDGYSILEEEVGVIPMTTFPFHKHLPEGITGIGTAGSVIKASSGYAFTRVQEHSDYIITQIKEGKSNLEYIQGKYHFYDQIFLNVVLNNPKVSGADVFYTMFSQKKGERVLSFLDGKTTLLEEMDFFTAPPLLPFLQSFIKVVSKRVK